MVWIVQQGEKLSARSISIRTITTKTHSKTVLNHYNCGFSGKSIISLTLLGKIKYNLIAFTEFQCGIKWFSVPAAEARYGGCMTNSQQRKRLHDTICFTFA